MFTVMRWLLWSGEEQEAQAVVELILRDPFDGGDLGDARGKLGLNGIGYGQHGHEPRHRRKPACRSHLFLHHMLSIIARPNSLQPRSVAPSIRRSKSYVTRFSLMVALKEDTIRSAASFHPICRSIISPDRITDPGLTLSCPAYFGAVPCVASKIAWPVS